MQAHLFSLPFFFHPLSLCVPWVGMPTLHTQHTKMMQINPLGEEIAFTHCTTYLLLELLRLQNGCSDSPNFEGSKVRNERDFCLVCLWMNGVNPSRKAQQRSASKKPVPQRSSTWADEQEAAARLTFSDARVALRMLVSESFHYHRKIAPNCDVAALRAKCREQLESIDRLYLADVPPLAILSALYDAHLWSTPPPCNCTVPPLCNCGNEKTKTTTKEKRRMTTTTI